MKTIELSARERNIIASAFAMPRLDKNGNPMRLSLFEQREAERVFDALRIDEVYERRAVSEGDWPDTPEEFKMEDGDFLHLEKVYKNASGWACSPPITRRVNALGDKLEALAKAKSEKAE